jgi:hypothetical protein
MGSKPYANIAKLRQNDTVNVDGNFGCRRFGPVKLLAGPLTGRLYFKCKCGTFHFLDEHDNGKGYVVGISKERN